MAAAAALLPQQWPSSCQRNGGTHPRGNQGQPPLQARSGSLELGSAHLNPDNYANDDQRGRESSVGVQLRQLSNRGGGESDR